MRYLALLVIVCVASAGQLLLKLSVTTGDGGAQSWKSYAGLFVNPYFIAGMVMYGCTSLAWMWALKTFPLSRVYPILALSFVIVPLLAKYVLQERIGYSDAFGMILILAGVSLMGVRL
jgi:drug/metabolite transporter (DMT)-like permease